MNFYGKHYYNIKMINDPLSTKEVKKSLIKNVKDYEKRMFRRRHNGNQH